MNKHTFRCITAVYSILLAIAFLLFTSCERRELEEELHRTALIPVSIIWSDANLDPDNDPNRDVYSASVWLFSKDGSNVFGGKSYKEYRLGDPRSGTIEVPVGRYSVLVFNNTVNDFGGNVAFRGMNAYDTFEYYAVPETRSNYLRAENEKVILEPDILAAWHLDDFEITADMLTRTRTKTNTKAGTDTRAAQLDAAVQSLTNVRPVLLTPRVHVVAHIKGLPNAASASAALQGMGSSVFLATGRTTPPPATYLFSLNNRQYTSADTMAGTIEASFNSFGPLTSAPDAAYSVLMSFTLQAPYKGSRIYPTPPTPPFHFNVSPQIDKETRRLSIEIRIGFEDSGQGGADPNEGGIDPMQEIILPDVGKAGGFGVGITDWGENIEVPINFK